MSGEKYTYVSNTELDNLRRRAARTTSLEESNRLLRQLEAMNANAQRTYQARIDSMNTQIGSLTATLNSRTAAASKEIQALRGQLQREIKAGDERLAEAERRNAERLQAVRREASREAAEVKETLEAELRTVQAGLQAEISTMQERLGSVESAVAAAARDEATLLGMAREYRETARLVLEDVHTGYRPELFFPGQQAQVTREVEEAEASIALAEKMPANSATARKEAKDALERAIRFRQQVIAAEQEWALHLQAAEEALNAAAVRLDGSRQLTLTEEMEGVVVNVDHWTDGDLTALEERLGRLRAGLEQTEALTVEALDGIRDAGYQAESEVVQTADFAVEAVFASQDRGEIAEDVNAQLNAQGFSLLDHGYQGTDQRAPHRIRLRNNATGMEIVITQTPQVAEDGSIVNLVESDILNYGTLNQELGDNIAGNVMDSLEGLGFQQSAVTTVPGYETRASDRVDCRDMEAWRTETKPAVRPAEKPAAERGPGERRTAV